MMEILWMATLAGVVGTGLGGVIGMVFGRRGDKAISTLLAFAGGVMLSIAFFDLVPQALAMAPVGVVAASIAGGVACIWLLNLLLARMMRRHRPGAKNAVPPLPRTGKGIPRRSGMLRTGALMFVGIALHNIPEGLAIGAGGAHQKSLGLVLAILIALHNIPEGMAVTLPLVEGGMGRTKACLVAALAGLPTLLGGLIGLVLGSAGRALVAVSLALAGGAMIYITFCEILPQSLALAGRRHLPACAAVAGVLFGLIMVQVLT